MLKKSNCQEKIIMSSLEKEKKGGDAINAILKNLDQSQKNNCGPIIINEIKKELLILREPIRVPRLHVSRLDYTELAGFTRDLCRVIPEYLAGHMLLIDQKPASETHSIQFVKGIKGKMFDFVHLLKIDLRFGTGVGSQIGGGTTEYYPEYNADGFLMSSLLIPAESIERAGESIVDFETIRIIQKETVGEGERVLVHAFFDDFDPTEINNKIWTALGEGMFPFSLKIYPFVSYSYHTASLNLPDPKEAILVKAVELFEPMAIAVISSIAKFDKEKAVALHPDSLVLNDNGVALSKKLVSSVSTFFSRYSVYQDEDFMLKRWRRLDVSP